MLRPLFLSLLYLLTNLLCFDLFAFPFDIFSPLLPLFPILPPFSSGFVLALSPHIHYPAIIVAPFLLTCHSLWVLDPKTTISQPMSVIQTNTFGNINIPIPIPIYTQVKSPSPPNTFFIHIPPSSSYLSPPTLVHLLCIQTETTVSVPTSIMNSYLPSSFSRRYY